MLIELHVSALMASMPIGITNAYNIKDAHREWKETLLIIVFVKTVTIWMVDLAKSLLNALPDQNGIKTSLDVIVPLMGNI